jgi:hypothetical protein
MDNNELLRDMGIPVQELKFQMVEGTIVQMDEDDETCTVTLDDYNSNYRHGPCPVAAHATEDGPEWPSPGDRCLVCFGTQFDATWVVSWYAS